MTALRTHAFRAFSLGALALALGCTSSATEVILTIDAECAVRGRATTLVLEVQGDDRSAATRTLPVSRRMGWPRQITLAPLDKDASRNYIVRVRVEDDEGEIFTTSYRGGYNANERAGLHLVLTDSCLSAGCAGLCNAGTCVETAPEFGPLPTFAEPAPSCTGPIPFDGGTDAGIDGALDASVDADVDGGVDGGFDAGFDAGPPPPEVVKVAAGTYHSCALFDDGEVYCWGSNDLGYLGEGSALALRTPQTPVCSGAPTCDPLTNVTDVVTHNEHTCVLRAGGTIACWGNNGSERLGVTSPAEAYETSAVDPGLTDVAEVDVGLSHTCVRHTDGSVQCFGANNLSQLGVDDPMDERFVSPELPMGRTAIDIDVGSEFTLAVLDDGSVYCWGSNHSDVCGANGDPGAVFPQNLPVEVELPDTVVARRVAAGGNFACALVDHSDASGTEQEVWCWGNNNRLQLGRTTPAVGGRDARRTPAPVLLRGDTPLVDVIALTVGGDHALAIIEGGTPDDASDDVAYGWGENSFGQVGSLEMSAPGQTYFERAVAIPLPSPSVLQASTEQALLRPPTDGHSCGLSDGVAHCWGSNDGGKLGDGTETARTVPTAIDFSGLE